MSTTRLRPRSVALQGIAFGHLHTALQGLVRHAIPAPTDDGDDRDDSDDVRDVPAAGGASIRYADWLRRAVPSPQAPSQRTQRTRRRRDADLLLLASH